MTTMRLLTGFGHALKSIPLGQLPAEAWRQLVGTSYDSGDLIDLYEHVPWLRRAVDARASALASMPYSFKRIGSDEELPVGEMPKLLFEMDLSALLEQLEGWYVLFGAAYIYMRRARLGGIPKGVRGLHPNTIRPEYSEDGDLQSFRRIIGAMQITLTPDEVAYIWAPNRKHEMGPGASPAMAALAAAGVLKNADAFAGNYFEQAPIAPTLVEVATTAQQSDIERVENWLTRRVSGVTNAFKALAVRSGVKFSQLAMIELGKLAMPEVTETKREDVFTALGVPQSFGTSRASTNATAEQDDFHFYDKTVIPQCRRFEPALNRIFKPLGYTMRFREDQLELYQKMAAAQAVTRVVPLVARRVLTIDEARAEVGYAALTPEQRAEIAPVAASANSDGVAQKSSSEQIFGYHIDLGVVKINEARAALGLAPLQDEDEARLRDLNRKLSTMAAARAAGLPASIAVQMVGLDLPGVSTSELENFFASMTPPPVPPVEGKSTHASDCQCGACKIARDPMGEARRADKKRFLTVALKRWDEGKFEKALDFTSEAMGAELDFIKGALESAMKRTDMSRDDIQRVFARADAWEGYP